MSTWGMIPIPAAAKRVDRSEAFIRRGVKDGSIQGEKLGRDWFVRAEEVERLAREYPLKTREEVSSG